MRVQDIMRRSPMSCGPTTNLAAVTESLWSFGCGALPIVDASGKVKGIITDRDICIALGTRNVRPSDLTAGQVMTRPVTVCGSNDDVHAALKIMQTKKMRRVPVVGEDGQLEGMLCLSDLVLQARHDDGSRPELTYEDVMSALRAIYWRPSPALAAKL